jgi:hypothetical protein
MLSDLNRDFRYAVRALLRAPTFAATVIAILALGIGANSVIFSAVDAVLLRDAPVSDPDTLVDVYTSSGSNLYSQSLKGVHAGRMPDWQCTTRFSPV